MSSAAVVRRIAVVSPCNFTPVEQGRNVPPATNVDAAIRSLGDHHPTTTTTTSAHGLTLPADDRRGALQCRRSSSSSSDDDATPASGTTFVGGTGSRPFVDGPKSGVKRAVGVVSPSSRTQTVVDKVEGGVNDVSLEPVRRRADAGSTVAENLSDLLFYHGQIPSSEAKRLLRGHPAGTYLLRDSQSRNPQFPFAISVVTKTTSDRFQTQSIRVVHCRQTGRYYLDCADDQLGTMPRFSSVRSLMDYLVESSKDATHDAAICLLSDKQNNVKLPLLLTRPLLKSSSTLSSGVAD